MGLSFGLLVTIFVSASAWGKTYLASPVQTTNAGWNQVEGYNVIMPPTYSMESQDISFCYGFAAATLINQMLYTTNPSHYQPISMLDLAINGLGMGLEDIALGENMHPTPQLNDFGNAYRVLVYGTLKKSIASEACMPFDRLNLLKSSNPKRSDDFKSFMMALVPAFSKKPEIKLSTNQVAETLLLLEPQLGNSKEMLEEILNQSKVESFEDLTSVMGKILIPSACKSQRLQIPSAQVAHFKIVPENRTQFLPSLKAILNQGRPLAWEFCINSSCDQQHVLVVSAWRKICKADACREQFLLRDSGDQVAPTPGDYWVDGADMVIKKDVMLNQYQSLLSKDMVPNMIMNLEY